MPTKRTRCVFCGKRLKPLQGEWIAPSLSLTVRRHNVCRSCGREQPPGTEWSDFKAEVRRALGRPEPEEARDGPLSKGDLVESAFGFSVGDRVALNDQRVTFGARQLRGDLEGEVTAVDPAARDSILTVRVRWNAGQETWVNHADVRVMERPFPRQGSDEFGLPPPPPSN